MPITLTTLLLALALTARLSRLVVDDKITQPLRTAAHVLANKGREWDPNSHTLSNPTAKNRLGAFLAELVECQWCTSVWTGTAAVLSAWQWGDTTAWQLVALVAGVSYVAGFLATLTYHYSDH